MIPIAEILTSEVASIHHGPEILIAIILGAQVQRIVVANIRIDALDPAISVVGVHHDTLSGSQRLLTIVSYEFVARKRLITFIAVNISCPYPRLNLYRFPYRDGLVRACRSVIASDIKSNIKADKIPSQG